MPILAAFSLFCSSRKSSLAKFTLAVANRITSHFANRLPGFGIITHKGRRFGRQYRRPVNVFRVPEGLMIALTYGHQSEWVQNALAAGNCEVETRGKIITWTRRLSCATRVDDDFRVSCVRFSSQSAQMNSCNSRFLKLKLKQVA